MTILFLFFFFFFVKSSEVIAIPSFTSVRTGFNVRGFWFESPSNFKITELYYPYGGLIQSTDLQYIQVVKFFSEPQQYEIGECPTIEFIDGISGTSHSLVNIDVEAGDFIGVLGERHSFQPEVNKMHVEERNGCNPLDTTICGINVDLYTFNGNTNLNEGESFECSYQPLPEYCLSQVQIYYCGEHCLLCMNWDVCEQCDILFYILDGRCVEDCQKNGPYFNNILTGRCDDCLPNCGFCTSSLICDECLNDLYLYRSRTECQEYCSFNGHYIVSNPKECLPCFSECRLCTNSIDCSECENDWYLFNNRSSCVEICPSGYYSLQNPNECHPCLANCDSCSTGNVCQECYPSFFLSNSATVCANICPLGYFPDTITSPNECLPCITNCDKCNSTTGCKKCSSGFFYDGDECVNDCEDGFFPDEISGICKPCSTACLECIQAETCVKCQSGYFLGDGDLVVCIECIPNCILCDDDVNCLQCNTEFELVDKVCIEIGDVVPVISDLEILIPSIVGGVVLFLCVVIWIVICVCIVIIMVIIKKKSVKNTNNDGKYSPVVGETERKSEKEDIEMKEKNVTPIVDYKFSEEVEKILVLPFDEVKLSTIVSGDEKDAISVVYEAKIKEKIVAFKVFNLGKFSEQNFCDFQKELVIYKKLVHPNILRLIDGCISNNRQNVGLVLEFCDKRDILAYAVYNRNLGNQLGMKDKIRMLIEICKVMEFLDEKEIVHGELNIGSVLVTYTLGTKLIYFLSSKFMKQKPNYSKDLYLAPEITLGEETSKKIDVYAFGYLMFGFIGEKEDPFVNQKSKIGIKAVQLATANDETFRPDISIIKFPYSTDRDFFSDLCGKCWCHQSNKRPSFNVEKNENKPVAIGRVVKNVEIVDEKIENKQVAIGEIVKNDEIVEDEKIENKQVAIGGVVKNDEIVEDEKQKKIIDILRNWNLQELCSKFFFFMNNNTNNNDKEIEKEIESLKLCGKKGIKEMDTHVKSIENLIMKLQKKIDIINSELKSLEKKTTITEEFKVIAFQKHQVIKNYQKQIITMEELRRTFLFKIDQEVEEQLKNCSELEKDLEKKKISKEKIKVFNSNIEVEDDKLCLICCCREKETWVYPCGHLCVCEHCSDELGSKRNFQKKCIYCKQEILRVYYLKSGKIIDFTKPSKDVDNDDGLCVLCKKNHRETVVDPCGHLLLCEECSDKLPNTKFKAVCIQCGKAIKRISFVKSSKEIYL